MSMPEGVQRFLDYTSIGTTIATVAGWLPNIAALLAIVWTLIRIYESRTVQKFLGRINDKKS